MRPYTKQHYTVKFKFVSDTDNFETFMLQWLTIVDWLLKMTHSRRFPIQLCPRSVHSFRVRGLQRLMMAFQGGWVRREPFCITFNLHAWFFTNTFRLTFEEGEYAESHFICQKYILYSRSTIHACFHTNISREAPIQTLTLVARSPSFSLWAFWREKIQHSTINAWFVTVLVTKLWFKRHCSRITNYYPHLGFSTIFSLRNPFPSTWTV